ncbi:helix-turn-helix transcriptional regulator [Amycolatopsis sp. EV170708-02-1]|uniref:helix-turn-helix domain-containing protein n=1 Tax=Amycolatopsis sp. EV170708-02-1 TaxID=2919322 RepID=UPI001F0CD4C9|nr:helix-turn-helix transcriptional regulator [Amycolatopsis sp. EV170708-02-1]UMP02239.1 helix-turn-helix domain-containing protein [Amycolatopsis sp. EV170708-02-1]
MRDDIDDLLGIDLSDPVQRLATDLVESDRQLLRRLVALRNEKKLTQKDIANTMGVTQPAVAALERADADPKLSTIRRYALAIGALIRHSVTDVSSHSPGLTVSPSLPATGTSDRKTSLKTNVRSRFVQVSR